MRIVRLALAAAVSLFVLASVSRGQDSNYWTSQYGSRATLLGGAVIGSVLDLSGTYYNPGGLALIEKPRTLIAANVFQYPRVTLVGTAPGSVPWYRTNPGPAPTLVAGAIRFRGLRDHLFAFSYVARQRVNMGVSSSVSGERDVLPELPGPEDFVTQFRLDEKLSESWFGLSWSYKISKRVGIGVTQYAAVRSHRAYAQALAEALSGGQSLALAVGDRQYSYSHVRVLWKVGLACDFRSLTLGLTLTTPSLAVHGRGETGLDSALAGLDVDGDGVPDDRLTAGYQNHLPATYLTPFSVAAGLSFPVRKVRVYGSLEWFGRVRPYTVVKGRPLASQSTGEAVSLDITQELKAVLNWGLGLEWSYSPRFKGYASVTTDFSARKPGTLTNLSLTDWDILNLVTGSEFMIKKSSLTAGIGCSFGGRRIGERPEILARSGFDGIWDPFASLKFRYICYKLVVGFAI